MSDIKIVGDIPKKYFGGMRHDEVDTEKFPLAFLTPHGTTKADLKRQETVRDWSAWTETVQDGTYTAPDGRELPKHRYVRHNGNTFEVDNEWIRGFTFDRVVTRYRTDNKVFRVQDPRGFTLEIYADCMIRVLQSATIVRGEIEDRCCWARREGKMYLLVENSEEHLEYVKLQGDRKTKPVPGDIIDQLGHKSVYVGDLYGLKFSFESDRNNPDGKGYYISSGSWNRDTTYRYVMRVSTTPKPWKVTVPWSDEARPVFTKTREWGKTARTVGRAPEEKILLPKFGERINDRRAAGEPFSPASDYTVFFRTKEEFTAAVAAGEADGWSEAMAAWRRAMVNERTKSNGYGGTHTTSYELRLETPKKG